MNTERAAERVREYIAKHGRRDIEAIRSTLRKQAEGTVPLPIIRAVLAGQPVDYTPPTEAPAPVAKPKPQPISTGLTKTFSLSSMRVATVRPKEGLKPKLFRLKKNTGYPLEELAEEWGVSVDTLRRDAKRLDAVLFVETAPGEWQQCVVHPDTMTERKA
jgi:hypothetical protein